MQDMAATRPQILHRYTGEVLFEGEAGMTTRQLLETATVAAANLYGANLGGADLGGGKLVGARPFFTIGPIGSRSDHLQSFITDKGVMIRASCFFDTRNQFELRVAKTHGMNKHGTEYLAALALIDAHAEIWAPKSEAAAD